MADSLKTFQVHLTAVMDSLVRASVCEITKLFQDTVNDYLVEISLNRKETEALKLRLRLTENKLRNERKYGLSWASRRAGVLASDETGGGGRKKRKGDTARGKAAKEWSRRAWEEGVGEAREQEEAGAEAGGRDVYLVHLPEGEAEEREERRRASGEGKEPANIKEESGENESRYRPDSLRLIKEALQMEPADPKTSSAPHSHTNDLDPASGSVGLASDDRSPSGLSGAQEDWHGEPACADGAEEGGASVDELSGLETALRAEREREKARSGLSSPTGQHMAMSGTRSDLDYVMSPKYIGLDGLCSSTQHPMSPHRAAGPASTGWTKRGSREPVNSSPPLLDEGEGLQLPSATGSMEEESNGEAGDFLHFCTQCGGGFNTTEDLEEHACPAAGSADEDLPFQCAACGCGFTHAWGLKNHECVPSGERPHRCELCGKRFMHSRSLERHQLVHTGERPHRCPQCGRSFSRLGNLERHQRIHTGERPYECGACGKRFSRVEYLKRHQHIHSGDRERAEGQGLHQCAHCGKTCADAEQLKNHQCFYNM
ncbi:zinc finger protein 316 isoform X2 [Engraulis encrasicolus]|uniref:zinc finger protein 316 isoform X2 n=1 Tax=Engraulis encrasicolus TaxID=184585 RepID=UPI002FD1CD4A